MTNRQAELFQKVLEQMETNLQENLNSDVQDYEFEDAQECLEGLKHIASILENFDDEVDRDDMSWVINELFKNFEEGIEFINAINDDFEILDEDGVKQMVIELQLCFKQPQELELPMEVIELFKK